MIAEDNKNRETELSGLQASSKPLLYYSFLDKSRALRSISKSINNIFLILFDHLDRYI